jgi:hypothetical protein
VSYLSGQFRFLDEVCKMESLLDTAAAAQWLTAHGIRRSPLTLRKVRCLGGGPTYRLLNGKPYYTEPDLVAWIEARLSAPLRNSSEVGVRPRPADAMPGAAPTPQRPRQ